MHMLFVKHDSSPLSGLRLQLPSLQSTKQLTFGNMSRGLLELGMQVQDNWYLIYDSSLFFAQLIYFFIQQNARTGMIERVSGEEKTDKHYYWNILQRLQRLRWWMRLSYVSTFQFVVLAKRFFVLRVHSFYYRTWLSRLSREKGYSSIMTHDLRVLKV